MDDFHHHQRRMQFVMEVLTNHERKKEMEENVKTWLKRNPSLIGPPTYPSFTNMQAWMSPTPPKKRARDPELERFHRILNRMDGKTVPSSSEEIMEFCIKPELEVMAKNKKLREIEAGKAIKESVINSEMEAGKDIKESVIKPETEAGNDIKESVIKKRKRKRKERKGKELIKEEIKTEEMKRKEFIMAAELKAVQNWDWSDSIEDFMQRAAAAAAN